MNKIEARRRVALAGFLAGAIAAAAVSAAPAARAEPGCDARRCGGFHLNGFADRSGFPGDHGPEGVVIAAGSAGGPSPTPAPRRGPNPKRASDLGGVVVAAGTGKPDPTPTPK